MGFVGKEMEDMLIQKAYGIYGNLYTVQYLGDDCIFETEEEAKQFIDEIITEVD